VPGGRPQPRSESHRHSEYGGHQYDPNQPRVPAGHSDGGQWTRQGYGGLSDLSPDNGWTPQYDNVAARPARLLSDLVPNNDGTPRHGNLAGRPARVLSDLIPDNDWIPGAQYAAGNEPNIQHRKGVIEAMKQYASSGYLVIKGMPVAVDIPGFATPRFYDFIVEDPATGHLIGVEVKTSLSDTIRLNPEQGAKDAVVITRGGKARLSGWPISGVGYVTYCRACAAVDLRPRRLYWTLKGLKIPFTHGGRPGETLP
jgi:hypothetical protein